METKKLVDILVKELNDRKAEDVVDIDVSDRTPLAEYYIIATAGNSRHLNALKESVVDKLEELKEEWSHVEGTQENGWILIDAYSIIINVFTREQRNNFDLDRFLTNNK